MAYRSVYGGSSLTADHRTESVLDLTQTERGDFISEVNGSIYSNYGVSTHLVSCRAVDYGGNHEPIITNPFASYGSAMAENDGASEERDVGNGISAHGVYAVMGDY